MTASASPTTTQRPSPAQMQVTSEKQTQVGKLEKNIGDAERAQTAAEFKSEVLQARQDLQDAAYSRLEISIGLFGLLLTILVIAFGFRTEKAAARAAKGELADRQKELDEIISQSRTAAEAAVRAADAAQSASTSADTHAKSAASHAALAKEGADAARAATINPAEDDEKAPIDQESVDKASEKLSSDRTLKDYRVLIRSSASKDDWTKVLKLSREMQISGCSNAEDFSFSLFQEAYALGKLGIGEIEIAVYDKLIAMFDNSRNGLIKARLISARINRGIAKAIQLKDHARVDDFQEIIDKYGKDKNRTVKEVLPEAYYQLAIAYAEQGKVEKVIENLKEWIGGRNKFECEEITESVFFKPLFNLEKFKVFLGDIKCELP